MGCRQANVKNNGRHFRNIPLETMLTRYFTKEFPLKNTSARASKQSHATLKIAQIGLSTRTSNVLARLGVQSVRDFRKLSPQQLVETKHCGIKSRQEILRVVRHYAPTSMLAIMAGDHFWTPASAIDLSVPEFAKKWPLHLLPISVRLQNVLQRLLCHTLGDLKNISGSMIVASPDCGARTISGLASFLKRVRRGRFGTPRERGKLAPLPYVVQQVDLFMEGLAAHHHTILEGRLGASGKPITLNGIGQKFHMTRERVRQIVNKLVNQALRAGGPPLSAALCELDGELTQKNIPLTRELLTRRTASLKPAPRRAPGFYIRLIGQLVPAISVWPGERIRPINRTPEEEKILAAITRWFFERQRDAASFDEVLAEALSGIRTNGVSLPSTKFLNALKVAPEFEVALRNPEKPRICFPAFPRGRGRPVRL